GLFRPDLRRICENVVSKWTNHNEPEQKNVFREMVKIGTRANSNFAFNADLDDASNLQAADDIRTMLIFLYKWITNPFHLPSIVYPEFAVRKFRFHRYIQKLL